MLTWSQFRDARPDLADAARGLFYQFSVGLAFLATVRRDGGPRVHPMCPVITEDALYAFIEPGPKLGDLRRDGRYALHGFPPADNEDAIYITGTAREVVDGARRAPVRAQFWQERSVETPPQADRSRLFEFLIETCMVTRTTGHGDWAPQHTIWRPDS
jgi:nitroimidazol reductase NimA-like FMN-containing flavoprotein (pyridoxamine 5'-phosphate oxidase superfamily)